MPANSNDLADLPVPKNRAAALLLISVLGLFLELLLIRWIGTEIRIFAYLQNTVLIVCFLGLGLGCFTSQRKVSIREILAPLVLLTVLLAVPWTRTLLANITNLLSVLDDLLIWEHNLGGSQLRSAAQIVAGLALTFALMALIWEIFMPIGRLLGRLMDTREAVIRAYSINVAGSLLGILLFAAISAFWLPPWFWLLAAAGLLVPFIWADRQQAVNFALLAVLLAAGAFVGYDSAALETHWSPYQKLVLKEAASDRYGWSGKLITVNNASYQGMLDLSPASVLANPQIEPERRSLSQYDLPLRFRPRPQRVLIVGAGSGNDAAGALRGGAGHVTAVEIDPAIIDMGRRHHPERPYDSPRVSVVQDDARSFFANADGQFELIIFGLLDSHTTTAMTNARLDHYVYTRESIARARQLLAPQGVMVLSFEATKPFIAERMSQCLAEVFQQQPLAFRVPPSGGGWGGVMFVVGDAAVIEQSLAADANLASFVARCQPVQREPAGGPTPITTDDWPYIYLEHARIPTLYYLLAGLMGGLLYYGQRRLKVPLSGASWQRGDWHFFCMGAAFLLLEVQNISKASVVLGNTWIVSAVIISAILVMILLANLAVARISKLNVSAVFGLLIVSCLAIYQFDLSSLAFLPYLLKAVLVGALTTLPMFFAGMIFIDSFARTPHKDRALGANLVGSLIGGMLQSLTFVIGIKALLLIVAGLYVAAWLVRPRPASRDIPLDDGELERKLFPSESAADAEPAGV